MYADSGVFEKVGPTLNVLGNVVSEKCLVHWPNLKQRAIDRALHEINEKTDLHLKLVAVGQAKYRRVLSLAFEIKEKKKKGRNNGAAA